jgi:hypothetical protein
MCVKASNVLDIAVCMCVCVCVCVCVFVCVCVLACVCAYARDLLCMCVLVEICGCLCVNACVYTVNFLTQHHYSTFSRFLTHTHSHTQAGNVNVYTVNFLAQHHYSIIARFLPPRGPQVHTEPRTILVLQGFHSGVTVVLQWYSYVSFCADQCTCKMRMIMCDHYQWCSNPKGW